MTTRHATTTTATETPPRPIAIGQLGLLLPFVLVVIFIVASGRASLAELALTVPFLAIPLAIFLLRWRAHAEIRGPHEA